MKSLILSVVLVLPAAAAEVFEANNGRETELPKGKEADGIRGDFVLRNDLIEALVSKNAHNRRANMSTFYGPEGVTPGCLYDLALRGSDNDQLICFSPCGHGPVSYVRIVPDMPKGEGAVETVKTAASNGGVFQRDEYLIRDGVQGLYVTTTFHNETDKPQTVATKSDFTRFEKHGDVDGGFYYSDAVDPSHKAGYAKTNLKIDGARTVGNNVELAPGAKLTIQRFIAVGRSPIEAIGVCEEVKGTKVGAGRQLAGWQWQACHGWCGHDSAGQDFPSRLSRCQGCLQGHAAARCV
jgi:hypothetical protein